MIKSSDNKFIKLFGYGSVLMIKLFEYFIDEKKKFFYYNNCSEICDIVLSCKVIYYTCKIFHSKRILLWTRTKDFDQDKLNLVRILCYDSNIMLKNKLEIFPKINKLVLGDNFNQPLTKDVLPNSLTQLTFGYNFNQPLTKDVLPHSLTQLTFGHNFNQPLTKDVLPNNLARLIINNKNIDFNNLVQNH